MLTIARAAADQFIYDVANIKYIAVSLPPRSLERKVPGPQWTVRQVLGHIEDSLGRQAGMLERYLAGEQIYPSDFSLDGLNAEGVAAVGVRAVDDLLLGLSRERDHIIAILSQMGDAVADVPFAGRPLDQVLRALGTHIATHALELVEALPELRFDPLVLSWLLYAPVEINDQALVRQTRLLEDARAHYAEQREES